MPEAVTYNDMYRRIVGAFPNPNPVYLIILQENFGKNVGNLCCFSIYFGSPGNLMFKDDTLLNGSTLLILIDTRVVNSGKTIIIPLRTYLAGNTFYTLCMKINC